MKILNAFLLILIFCASCKKPEKNDRDQEKITVFRGSLESLVGPKEELSLLESFPHVLYKIYPIDNLGSFYIDSRVDIIKNELRLGNAWESNFVEILKKYVKPGDTVVDIGAHIGTHTLSMSKLVGSEGRVVAFEPQIKLYSELVMNMLLNKCQNVIAYRCALGHESNTIEMSPSIAGNEGGTSIGCGGDAAEMITLDSLNLNHVSFIKIDVENYEYEVLIGALQTIVRCRPYIVIEIMGNTYNPIPNRDELVQRTLHLLENLGYTAKYIEGSWSDWLAIPSEKV